MEDDPSAGVLAGDGHLGGRQGPGVVQVPGARVLAPLAVDHTFHDCHRLLRGVIRGRGSHRGHSQREEEDEEGWGPFSRHFVEQY